MGIRIYAWGVNLTALRALVRTADLDQLAQLRARMDQTPEDDTTLPGHNPVRALQNWQLAGLGRPAPAEDVLALAQGTPPEDGAAAVHALITLCGLLGTSLTGYSFYSYRPRYSAVRPQFRALGVPPQTFDPERDIFFADATPPVQIPLPADGLPGVHTIEAEVVAEVAPLLARRGLDPARWAAELAVLHAWGDGNAERQQHIADFLAKLDAALQRAPSLVESLPFELGLIADDLPQLSEAGAELLAHTAHSLQAQVDDLDEDALDVFAEIARWFEAAAAEQQGLVLLIT